MIRLQLNEMQRGEYIVTIKCDQRYIYIYDARRRESSLQSDFRLKSMILL